MATQNPTADQPDDRLLVGVVIGAHGVRGWLRVKSFTDQPEHITGLSGLQDRSGGPVRLRLKNDGKKGAVIVEMAGVSDRSAAERLKGHEFFVPRSALPETQDDEYYHADLLGLSVETLDGVAVGQVTAVNNYGAGDVIDIVTGDRQTVVLPFNREIVPDVDLVNRRLIIDPPDGFLGNDTTAHQEDLEPHALVADKGS